MGGTPPEILGLRPREMQSKLAGLVTTARLVDAKSKGAGAAGLGPLLHQIRSLVEQALEALDSLEQCADGGAHASPGEPAPDASPPFVDAGEAPPPGGFEELANLCFVIRSELRIGLTRLEKLSTGANGFGWMTVVEGLCSKVVRGLCAVEGDLARVCGLGSMTRYVDLRRDHLRVRRLMSKFRLRVATARSQEATPEKMLRTIGASLAWLRGQDDFSTVRASDRLTAKGLQERILEWSRSEEREAKEAEHIGHEVDAFIQLLDLINRREELVTHDFEVATLAIGLLAKADPAAPVAGLAEGYLRALAGRDEALDDLLHHQAPARTVLARLVLLRQELAEKSRSTQASSR